MRCPPYTPWHTRFQFWPLLPVCWHAINWSRNVGLIFNHSWKNKVLGKRKVSILVCTFLWAADSLMRFFFFSFFPIGHLFSALSRVYVYVWEVKNKFFHVYKSGDSQKQNIYRETRGASVCTKVSIQTLSTFLWFALPVSSLSVLAEQCYKNVLEEQGRVHDSYSIVFNWSKK